MILLIQINILDFQTL